LRQTFLQRAAFWLIPPVFAFVVYRPALDAWFQADDFVWLNLALSIHSWEDLRYALFHPTIHGTWRPLGERIYFVVLQSVFGFSSGLPFRVIAFLGQFANMALVSLITLRITRSRIAGFLAPILWMSSDKLALTMVWNSNINYVAGGFFILTALWFLLRHIETNRTRDLAAMWAAFLLGLCALEMTIVFPLMAAAYTCFCARPYFKKTLPLFAAAALFGALHFMLAPNRQAAGPYKMHFDGAIFSTLAAYWKQALEPENLAIFTRLPHAFGTLGMVLFTIALLGYAGYQAVRRNFLPLVFLSWFVALLLPVLPLRDHFFTYYLGLPLIGIAMLAAGGFAAGWRGGLAWRGMALALLAFFLVESPYTARKATKMWAYRSWAIHAMVTGVADAHRLHPDRAILLQNIDDTLFWGGIYYECFRILGLNNVYLAPDPDLHITPHPEIGDIARFVMPAAAANEILRQGKLSVYAWNHNRLEDVTARYVPPESAVATAPSAPEVDRVDVGDPHNADRLDDAWYVIDNGIRWMPKRASVRMKTGGRELPELRVSGYCPAAAVKKGAVHMTVSVNGAAFKPVTIDKGDASFEFGFPLPPAQPKEIEVTVELDRTFRMPPDQRDLGMVFGVFEIRGHN